MERGVECKERSWKGVAAWLDGADDIGVCVLLRMLLGGELESVHS